MYIKQTDSTNRELWRMLDAGQELPAGFTLWAGDQTAGKGLGNTSWISQPFKNLTFSLLLKPVFLHPAKQFLLNKAIAVAIITALSEISSTIAFQIKWPNDIYFNNKKIAGTLIENRIMGQKFEACVVGVGVNINQREFSADLPNPTSLALLSGKDYEINGVMNMIQKHIMLCYTNVKQQSNIAIHNTYLEHLLGFGRLMQFASEGKIFYATIVDVNDYGKLILQDENGDQKEFAMKEIELVL